MYQTHFHIVVVMLGIDMLRKGDEIISKVSCPRICEDQAECFKVVNNGKLGVTTLR